MNLEQFNTLADKTRLSELAKHIAMLVMVEDKSPSTIAREFGISRQTLYNYLAAVKKADLERVKLRNNTYLVTHKEADYLEARLIAGG